MFAVLDLVSIASLRNPHWRSLLSGHSYLLVRHPDVMSRLRSEITSVLGGNDSVTRADLKQLGYLTNVLKESSYLIS